MSAADAGRPYVLHGWHLSYFSGKTRAYLRYKGVPFVDRDVDAYTLLWKVPRKTGATVMPVVVTPEGEWLQDSKHITDVLERRFPQSPVKPATPRQRIAAQLLEAWADEWWIPPAMHYRWSYPENYALFERDAGHALLPGFPWFLKKRLAAYVARKLRGYLPSVGVVPEQHALMERWTENTLDALERHFAALPYLFGTKPSVADFALLGPLYGHLGRDPMPKRELVGRRPHLKDWIARMNAPRPGSGEFLPGDTIPPTLRPLLDAVFKEFYPMVAAIRDELHRALPALPPGRRRLPRALGRIGFPMGDGTFRRQAMPYTLWMMQRVLDDYRSLDPGERASVDAWLAGLGAPAAMRFDIGVRLVRVGLSVALEPAPQQ
ncbi:MAG: glutathione S-transferase family protein [Gammaproteobacteria bacterium]|nr:glutathione S-transferase family protein [Gammaproteobacteria bacterium]